MKFIEGKFELKGQPNVLALMNSFKYFVVYNSHDK